MKKWYLTCAFLTVLLVACKDDDKEFNDSKLTPDEHKAKLEQVGMCFVDEFNSSDHKTAITAVETLIELTKDESFGNIFSGILTSINKVVKTNDLTALLSLTNTYKWSDYYGIYSYQNNVWTYTESKEKAEFRYTSMGKTVVATASYVSSGKSIQDKDGYMYEIPLSADVKLVVADQEEVNMHLTMSLADDLKAATVAVKLAIARNYVWEVSTDAKDSKVEAFFAMSKSGHNLVGFSGILTGKKLTSPDEVESPDLNTASFEANVMSIGMKGNGNIKAIVVGLDLIDEEYSDWDKTEAQAKKEADLVNKNMSIEMYYTDTEEKVADILMAPYICWSSYDETSKDYDTEPVMKFISDGSLVSVDSYFGDKVKFADLIRAVELLGEEYRVLLGL